MQHSGFLHKTPFVRFLLPLICGILVQHYTNGVFLRIVAFSLSFIFLLYALFSSKNSATIYKNRWSFGVGIFCFFFACGPLLYHIKNERNTWSFSSEEAIYSCRIIDTPVEKEKTFLYRLHVNHLLDKTTLFSIDKQILCYISKDSLSKKLSVGGELLINARITPPKNNGNPDEFDYAFYLKQQGISGIAFVQQSHWSLLDSYTHLNIKQIALQFRSKLISIYESFHLPTDEKAILSAITLGYKADLSPELKDRFSSSGASHVLAVSGLHVGILFMVTGFILAPFGRSNNRSRILKNVLIIVFLWIFAFITGLSPSVVRAVTMFSLSITARIINRDSSIFNSICVSAFIMLIYNPLYLFDVSFQLSYSAVISIIIFSPHLQSLFTLKNYFLKSLWGLITVSIAAQIGTFPFVLYYFHQFPHYFILTNIIIIPLAYLIIMLSIAALFTHVVFGNTFILKELLKYCLSFMNNSISKINNLPYASTQDIWLHPMEVILIFAIVIFCCYFLLKKRFLTCVLTLSSCIILLFFQVTKNYQSNHQSYITFFSQRKSPVINVVQGKDNYVYTTDVSSACYVGKNTWMKNGLQNPFFLISSFQNEFLYYQGEFICFGDETVYILTDNKMINAHEVKKPVPVNYLLVGNKFSGSIEQVLFMFSPKMIVLDATLPYYICERLQKECEDKSLPYHNLAQNGALTVYCQNK